VKGSLENCPLGHGRRKYRAQPLELNTWGSGHTPAFVSKLKLPFNIVPAGGHNYPRETVTVHKHLCHFLLDSSSELAYKTQKKTSLLLSKETPNVLKSEKSWNKHTAIQSTTSKEDKINLGFRISFNKQEKKKDPQKAKYLQ